MPNWRHRKQPRSYRFRPGGKRKWRRVLLFACAIILVISIGRIGSYISDYVQSVRLSAALRDAYLSEEISDVSTAPASVTRTPSPMVTATAAPAATSTAEASSTLPPYATLAPMPYPQNPYRIINARFQKLRRQNEDIIGWLSAGELLSEAVVQRDNEYYLRRDYRGYHNNNGAIFLDEDCSLATRPHTLILYGHNMKTGAMFGGLRNYENITYYRNSPFISFDTIYEEGRYVVFSVAEISLDRKSPRYSGFYRLPYCTILERESIIRELCKLSIHTCPIDVQPDDQLLLLVTCASDNTDRRIVAARRVRDGETENALYRAVQNARKQ